MSKKYKNKVCVYCATNESTAPDHVIARKFFPEDQRGNLPQVPICDECNTRKSYFETYAETVLPFGYSNVSAKDMLQTDVSKRLNKNLKLKRKLSQKIGRIWLESKSNIVLQKTVVPVEREKLIQLFEMIIRGLYHYTFKTILPKDYFVEIYELNYGNLILFYNMLLLEPNNFIQKELGNGIFYYKYATSDEDQGISVWEMSFYNGMMITRNAKEYLFFCGLTGPEEIRNNDTTYLG